MANFDLSKLMEGKNPQALMLAETRQLKAKWEKTGLLEGMKEREQHSMAVLLENQAKQLLDEATQTGTSAGSEEWSGVALPLVRRIFGEIAAKEFVSVQPMNLPSGLVFFLDFKYGSSQGNEGQFGGKSLFGGTNITGSATNFGRTNAAVNGLYGEARYGYSVNDGHATVTATGNAVAGANVVSSSVTSWAEVGFDAALSSSVSAGQIFKFAVSKSAIDATADTDAVRAFQVVNVGTFANLNQFNYYNSTNGMVYLYVSASGLAAAGQPLNTIDYSVIPVAYNRGDFEDQTANAAGNTTTALDIPEIDLELKSEAIVAKTRKLKAVWTPELAQDLNAYHSIDAEAELTSMLSDYISLEIDLEILDMLRSNALTTDYWSATIGEEYLNNGQTNQKAWGSSVPSGANSFYTKNTWYQTLGIKLNKVSNKIHQLTLRGGANFVVASPDVCTILESIPGFTVNAEKDAMQFAAGVTAVGSMSNRYTVYKNPYMTSNEILMGYRGNNFLETGAVYAPYVPLIMTPLVYDPQNFTPRRGVMTRYAKKMVRPEYYGKIFIKDLANI
jgi:Major capsid protein Gp23